MKSLLLNLRSSRGVAKAIALATMLVWCPVVHAQYWTTPATVPLPSVPSGTYSITSYGASTGSSDNSTAIQNAINAASVAGGGTVQVPSGTFLSGPLTLKSKVNLNLASGSTLRMLAYGTWPSASTPLITCASGSTDLEISGSGTIDGQGQAWWTANATTAITRPQEVILDSATRVEITGIKLTNSPEEHIWLKSDNDVTVTGITISTLPVTGLAFPDNTDGVDLVATNAYLANNNIACGDDNIVMEGQYIDLENNTFGVGHGCSIGSITTSGVSFVTVNQLTMNGTTAGIRMKSARGRGGVVQYLSYNNITMTNVPTPVFITSYYPTLPASPSTDPAQPVTSTTPIWKHIKITGVTATGSTSAGILYGLPEEKINDVTFSNVKLTATTGMDIYHATGIVFTGGSTITVSSGAKEIEYDASVTGAP